MTSAIPPAIREYAAIAAARHATVPPDLTRTSQRTGVPREDGSDLTAAYALAQHLAGGTETDATDATYRAVTALNHTIHPIEAAEEAEYGDEVGALIWARTDSAFLLGFAYCYALSPLADLQPADREMFLRLIDDVKRAIVARHGDPGGAR